MMKAQYQQEVSQIHVPEELLEKTKKAMKEEEDDRHSKKRRKAVPSGRVLWTAAAALLLIVIVPTAAYLYTGDDQTDQTVQVQFGAQQNPAVAEIAKKAERELQTEAVEEKPDEFADAEAVAVNGENVYIIKDSDSGYLKAFYETDMGRYVITSRITEKEEFLMSLEETLSSSLE